MKLCSYSSNFKNIIEIILQDNVKDFTKNIPPNFLGQIDKMSFIDFCFSTKAYKIIKYIVKNQSLRENLKIKTSTLKLLLDDKNLNSEEKTYIYTKIIKNSLNINKKRFFKLLVEKDIHCIHWLKNNNLNLNEYLLLFSNGINESNMKFCRKKKLDINYLIVKAHKKYLFDFENNTHFLSKEELLSLVLFSLNEINKSKESDINLLDSIIQILINNQNLITEIPINMLEKSKIKNQLDLFDFLNMDIEKILLYKKFSQGKLKGKVKKI